MEHTEKLNAVSEAIKKAVPSIMDCKFGCKIKCIDFDLLNRYGLNGIGIVLGLDSCVFNDDLKYIRTGEKTHRTVETSFVFQNPKLFEILGRDIEIHDVMIAIQKAPMPFKLVVDAYGVFWDMANLENSTLQEQKFSWDMGKPLHQQDEKVISFLYSILVKNI